MIIQLKTLWFHPITRCVASCILGFALWIVLRIHYDYVRIIAASIKLQGLQSKYIIAPEVVRITVRGPWRTIANFIHKNPTIIIDTHLLQKGLQEITVTSDQLQLPAKLHIIKSPTIPIFVNPNT